MSYHVHITYKLTFMSGGGGHAGGVTAGRHGFQARDHCSRQCFNVCECEVTGKFHYLTPQDILNATSGHFPAMFVGTEPEKDETKHDLFLTSNKQALSTKPNQTQISVLLEHKFEN